jgi:hypothetical protein
MASLVEKKVLGALTQPRLDGIFRASLVSTRAGNEGQHSVASRKDKQKTRSSEM